MANLRFAKSIGAASTTSAVAGGFSICIMDPLLLLEPERLRTHQSGALVGESKAFVNLQVRLPKVSRLVNYLTGGQSVHEACVYNI